MGRKMSLEEVGRRAATKRNNRARREMPLLAATGTIPDEMLTTPEAEQTRIIRQREQWDLHRQWMGKKDVEMDERARRMREVMMGLVDEVKFEEMDRKFRRLVEHWGAFKSAAYRADYWWTLMRKIAPEKAEEWR